MSTPTTVRLPSRGQPIDLAWIAFASFGLVVVAFYYALPDGNGPLFLSTAVGFAAVAAIIAGVRLNRPEPALPWYLIGGGTLLFALGDVVWTAYAVGGETPFPSVADVLYICGYPLLAAGGLLLLRPLGRGQRRLASIDAAVIAIGFAVPTWTFLIQPYTEDGAATLANVVLLAYPSMDLVLVVLLARLLLTPAWMNPSFWLFVAGAGLMLTADIAYYGIAGTETYYSWLDAFYMLNYVCWGTAALHPSMARLSADLTRSTARLTPFGVALMAVAAVAVPATLARELWGGGGIDAFEFAAAAVLVLLVLFRMGTLVQESERAREEEGLARAEAESAQRLLSEQNDRLRELDRVKDEFVSLVSHELRTPLTSITGYVDLLLEDDEIERDESRRFLEIVHRNGYRLLRLVDDLLFLARFQEGRLELEFREADLALIVADAVQGLRPRADAQGVELRSECEESVLLEADPARLGQLCDNVLSNAVKFTPRGGTVTVRASVEGERALLEVSDTGIGIPAEEVERLYERFFRATSATERQIQGTGLGLTITKAIVDAHDGRIEVVSEIGAGTTFRVEIPRTVRKGSSAAAPVPTSPETALRRA